MHDHKKGCTKCARCARLVHSLNSRTLCTRMAHWHLRPHFLSVTQPYATFHSLGGNSGKIFQLDSQAGATEQFNLRGESCHIERGHSSPSKKLRGASHFLKSGSNQFSQFRETSQSGGRSRVNDAKIKNKLAESHDIMHLICAVAVQSCN